MNSNDLDTLRKSFAKAADINGRDEFLNSSVLVPLILIHGEYHLIFQKRSKNISQPGEICFPGGRIDPKIDNNSLETALRETDEEFGIKKEKISVLGRLNSVYSPVGLMVDGYLGVVDIKSLSEIQINHSEVEYIFSVPVSFFENKRPEKYHVQIKAHPYITDENGKENVLLPSKQLKLPEVYSKAWGNSTYGIYVYKYKEEIIWGLTARLIVDAIERIGYKY